MRAAACSLFEIESAELTPAAVFTAKANTETEAAALTCESTATL
ncbi:hypothetical protein [Mammaliicoccus sciuri]|nr:hypothetical protein [Mammaliicoccus sciuri]